jgi:hypothetical protein
MNIRTILILSLVVSGAALSQPSIHVHPDSISLPVEWNSSLIDSISIANLGNDTLTYSISTRYAVLDSFGSNVWLANPQIGAGDSLTRGEILQATEDVLLLEFGYSFESHAAVHMEFFVFEADSGVGEYHKIFSVVQAFDTLTGTCWLSSGPINVTAYSGKFYLLGVSWDRPISYRYFPAGLGSDGPSMKHRGGITVPHSFPSDSSYVISTLNRYSGTYETTRLIGYPLFLRILSNPTQSLAPSESASVVFEARKGGWNQQSRLSYLDIMTNDPIDSIKHVKIFSPYLVGVESRAGEGLPQGYALSQNYPNPFNPSTIISYALPIQSFATLKVFNVLGQEVAMLVNGIESPGSKSVTFDGSGLPSGVYFYRLQAGSYSATKMLMIVK